METIEQKTEKAIQAIASDYACTIEEDADWNGIRHQNIYTEAYDAIYNACIKNAGIIEHYFTEHQWKTDIAFDFCDAVKDEIIDEFECICERIAEDFEDYEITYQEITFDEDIFRDIICECIEEE